MTTATTETPEQALQRIQGMGWGKNDAMAIMAFADRGIDPELIDPRHNVLTFKAWKAAGRQVAKGATSVRVTVWIPKKGKKGDQTKQDSDKKGGMWPKVTSLFHISQTIPADAPKGTRPEAWNNPALVKPGTYDATAHEDAIKEAKANPWTEETPIEQVEAEMEAVLTGQPVPAIEFSGPTIGDIKPPAVIREKARQLDLFAADDEECSCPMAGVITNVECPLHGKAVTA